MLKPKNLQEALDQLEDAKVPTSKQCTCSMRLVNLNRLDSIEKLDASTHAFDSFARITKSNEQYFFWRKLSEEKITNSKLKIACSSLLCSRKTF